MLPRLHAYPLLQNCVYWPLPSNGWHILLNYSLMSQYYKSQHILIKFAKKAYSEANHRCGYRHAIFSGLASGITHNLRHCDLVQLHGFLGRIPFGSNVVLVATLGLDWWCKSPLAALLLDVWLTACVLRILCCCWVCCCGCWLWFCNCNCKHICKEQKLNTKCSYWNLFGGQLVFTLTLEP
jgi:hypothetical protein